MNSGEVVCPRCGRKNSALARRCQGCGLDLTELSELSGVRRPDTPSQISLPPRNLMPSSTPTIDLSAPSLPKNELHADLERETFEESQIKSIPDALRRLPGFWLTRSIAVSAFIVVFLGMLWLVFGRALWPAFDVTAQIVRNTQGEFIDLHFTNVDAGSAVNFVGERAKVDGHGNARFQYYVQGLSFGENSLEAEISFPSGRTLQKTVTVDVPYRVLPFWHRYDFDTGRLPITVQAYPSTQVEINGEKATVDAGQSVELAIPIIFQDEAWEQWIPIQVTVKRAGSVLFSGRLKLYAKRAGLFMLGPPLESVTQEASVLLAGQVGATADVEVQGRAVKSEQGTFRVEVPLNGLGVQHVEVIVRESGFLPNRARIPITRVHDLREAYAEYRIDLNVDWPALWKAPAKFVGTRVEVSGIVEDVSPNTVGKSFLLNVESCATPNQCLLWVDYPLSRAINVNDRVHVRGRIAGERPMYIDAQSKAMRIHPFVEAAFVLQQTD